MQFFQICKYYARYNIGLTGIGDENSKDEVSDFVTRGRDDVGNLISHAGGERQTTDGTEHDRGICLDSVQQRVDKLLGT